MNRRSFLKSAIIFAAVTVLLMPKFGQNQQLFIDDGTGFTTFDDNSDGNITITGEPDLLSDTYYKSLIVPGDSPQIHEYRIFVKGTYDIRDIIYHE